MTPVPAQLSKWCEVIKFVPEPLGGYTTIKLTTLGEGCLTSLSFGFLKGFLDPADILWAPQDMCLASSTCPNLKKSRRFIEPTEKMNTVHKI